MTTLPVGAGPLRISSRPPRAILAEWTRKGNDSAADGIDSHGCDTYPAAMFVIWNAQGARIDYRRGAFERIRIEPTERLTALSEEERPPQPDSPPARSAAHQSYRRATQTPRHEVHRVAEIMSRELVTCSPDTPMRRAREIVRERRFRHLPVVTPDGTIVGMLSDRELLANSWDERNVSARMATPVLTATPDASIRDVARVLLEERIGAMPIADEHGRLVGLLTRTDILRAVVARAPLELWT